MRDLWKARAPSPAAASFPWNPVLLHAHDCSLARFMGLLTARTVKDQGAVNETADP